MWIFQITTIWPWPSDPVWWQTELPDSRIYIKRWGGNSLATFTFLHTVWTLVRNPGSCHRTWQVYVVMNKSLIILKSRQSKGEWRPLFDEFAFKLIYINNLGWQKGWCRHVKFQMFWKWTSKSCLDRVTPVIYTQKCLFVMKIEYWPFYL